MRGRKGGNVGDRPAKLTLRYKPILSTDVILNVKIFLLFVIDNIFSNCYITVLTSTNP